MYYSSINLISREKSPENMNKSIFPKEIIEITSESHFSKHSTRSSVIYITVITSLLICASLLPLISVDVGVRSHGVVRPVSEIKPLISLVPGRLELLSAEVNDFVAEGALIARIASPVIDEKLTYNEVRCKQAELHITDLSRLLRLDSSSVKQPPVLLTPRYRNSWQEMRQRLHQAEKQIAMADAALERNEHLLRLGYSSQATYDDLMYNRSSAVSEYHLILGRQKNNWQADLHIHLEEFDRLQSDRKQLEKERELYQIRSPVSGTIQNLAGIATGSLIHPNQVIAEITPDTTLIIEVYVAPSDIGLIREQMKVRIQVSAYNYNQWGILDAVVTGISQDADISGSVPYFRVRCKPGRTYLTLRNGYRGNLIKGMTVQARFIVNRRSLLQLLYDKIDDWLNPSWGVNGYNTLAENETGNRR